MQLAPKHPVPIFPLPGLVLFPQTQLPLHIFELRYRTMVREALSGDRLFAMTLLKPGWERNYHGSPEFFPLGCLARFEEVEWLPNDCYDVKVLGLTRVRVERVTREYPYRAARVQLAPEEPYTEDDPLVELEKRALVEILERLRMVEGGAQTGAPTAWGDSVRYDSLVNTMCMLTDTSPAEKLELLQLDSVIERGRRIREMTERLLREPIRRTDPGGEQN